ncbi:MAG: carboxylating nicotinate-nucleotide diphosphorylase, partial [Thermoplasmata archaeon]|nr:carboxylating nicotinate-nucleotide diphosphorylase [Thermoplasmata archaeon]
MRRPVVRVRGPTGSTLPPGTRALLVRALAEDRVDQDHTTRAILPGARRARARVTAEGHGRLSGMDAALALARIVGLEARTLRKDGARVRPGTPVLELSGDLRRILAIERTLLNFLMHLSGVASATASARTRAGDRLRIFGTRKTLPGLRALEKQAIRHGGGDPHRSDLATGLLVKNNHLAVSSIRDAVARLRSAHPRRTIEVEVRSRAGALEAVRAGADALLIDNAGPFRARSIARAARAAAGGRALWIEVSGSITPSNVAAYRSVGADAASLGALTHSAPALPFHLRVLGRAPSR